MKSGFWLTGAALLLGGCASTAEPTYALTGGEKGVFHTLNAGRPISVNQIKGMDEAQLQATFGAPRLDRKDGPTRALRYQSDGCSLFVYMTSGRAQYAEAYDPQLRPLVDVDQCAGSVAAQKKKT